MDHHTPVRFRPRRGPLLAAVALLALTGLLACRERPAEKEAPETAATVAPPPTVPPAVKAKQREKAVAEALELAPQLNRASAEMLWADADRRGVPYGDVRDWSLLIANRGFTRLSSERLKELGDLFTKIYDSMPQGDRAVVMAYVERLRRGDLGTASDDERGRVLMSGGIRALPDAARARLQALFEASIAMVFEDEIQNARLAGEPEPTPPRGRAEDWTSPGDATLEHDDGDAAEARRQAREESQRAQEEAQMSSQAAGYKSQLESLEQQVRSAEEGVQSAQQALDHAKSVPLKERSLGSPEVAAAERSLEAARERQQRAQAELDELMARIRQEKVPPHLLR